MEKLSDATLSEMFAKRLAVLHESLGKLDKLRAPLERPAGLLRLPFEIRLQIYHYCIPRKHIIDVSIPRFPYEWPYEQSYYTLDQSDFAGHGDNNFELADTSSSEGVHLVPLGDIISSENASHLEDRWWNPYKNQNSIFLLSKQISGEALDVLYGDNTFKVHLHGEGEIYLKKNFAEGNRKRMRYLLLIAQAQGVSYIPSRIPDDGLWCSILPQLKVLRIVAEQPPAAESYSRPTPKKDLDCWVKWIRPFLKCFSRHLLKQTIVEVDCDSRVETEALFKESLPCGYRQIRCRLGDLIFKRGQFSWESGYWDDDGPTSSRDADGDWGSD